MQRRLEICTELWLRSLKGREHLEDVGVRYKDNIEMDFRKYGVWH